MLELADKPSVICLMGPTACGKTAAAIDIVERHHCDIISVDSAMVYKGLDIGSAKPTTDELAKAPHRLIDIRDPAQPYSVGEFCDDARLEITKILHAGRTPLLVGGTMMYFYQLQSGLSELPAAAPEIREKILQDSKEQGWPALHEKLKKIDPAMAMRLNPNDSQRISRALEIFYQTKQTLTEWQRQQTITESPYDFINLILAPESRQLIHQRIATRFDSMLEQGFIEEAKALYEREDLHAELPAIRSVGYRQAWDYFDGKCDLETMREKAIIATRQLCKRQFTWLRRWQHAKWFCDSDTLSKHIECVIFKDHNEG